MWAILKGHSDRQLADFEAQRMVSHELAALVAIAQHNPKELPPYRPMNAEVKRSDEADQARLRGALISMALASTRKKDG